MPLALKSATIVEFLNIASFNNLAVRGKTSVVNEQGELLNLQITPGNPNDRKPVRDLLQSLFGKVLPTEAMFPNP